MSNDTLHTIENIFADLLIFVGAMAALLVVLLIVVALLPATNPLKRILTALSFRVGATAAAGALAIPVEPIDQVHLEVEDLTAAILDGSHPRIDLSWSRGTIAALVDLDHAARANAGLPDPVRSS